MIDTGPVNRYFGYLYETRAGLDRGCN